MQVYMEDIQALSLVREEIKNIQRLSILPDTFDDDKQRDDFKNDFISIIEQAVDTINPIADYAKEINKYLKELRASLHNSTKAVQERLREILNRVRIKSSKPENEGNFSSVGIGRKRNSSVENRDAQEMALALQLEEIEEVKQKLHKSIVLTQKVMNDIDTDMGATKIDVDNLKDSITDWVAADRNEQKEEQRKKYESRQRSAKEEQRKNEADDKMRKKKEEQKQKKENDHRRKEKQEKKQEEEEKQIKCEEERVKRDEAERNSKMEEARMQKENEERLKSEEENMKSKYEEEKRLKEEEARRQREQEEIRLRREAEEERKRQKKREEDERMRKQKEERKRIEEEIRKKNPANWIPFKYKRPEVQTDAFHGGICCQVAAMDGLLKEEDLECLASDEWREDDKPSVLNVDEKLVSSIISINAKSGEKIFPVPMRVYAPHCSVSNSSDEIVVKLSIDGGEWAEQCPVSDIPAPIGQLGMNYTGIDVSKFKNVKIVAVAKTRSQEFVVDECGSNTVSTVDKNIKLFVPRDTFRKPCKLRLEVRQINDDSLLFATQHYEHCQHVLSTSSVMKITSETVTDRSIELDLARKTRRDKMSREKGKYIHVYKCRGDSSWKIADSEFKGRNMDVSVTLPSRKESYVVMEIEGRPTVPTEDFLKAADELYFHSNASIVRVIAKQKRDDQKSMIIQCVKRDQVASRILELQIKGYIHGPDTSKEFSLLDGQCITLKCSGNINMDTGSEVKLTFHSYMDTAKQEARLQVVDEFRQKDSNVFFGNLHFEVMADNRDGAFYTKYNGSLPLTLPKEEREHKKKVRIEIHFPHYLTALAKFLAIRLTTQPKDDTWIQVIYSLDSRPEMDNIKRRDVASSEIPDDDRKICEQILLDWMKNTPVKDDKVKLVTAALKNCQRKTLADECNAFVSFHKEYMSNTRITEMARNVEDDWESFALTIGLSETEIDTCRQEDDDLMEKRELNVLYKWRVSEVAITSSFDVFNDLLKRLENAQSNMELQKYIRQLSIEMK